MRLVKGKWKASYKDTFSLDYTLNPIIHAALVRFYENKDKTMFGTPSVIYSDLFGLDYKMADTSEDDESKAQYYWYECIEKMIYAFDPKSEPNIADYDFSYSWHNAENKEPRDGIRVKTITCSNEEEKERYQSDCLEYERKAKEGRELFAKYYMNLWW